MTALELKNFFKYLWENKVLIAFTLLIGGVLDLIGITTWDFGTGFVLGFLMLFVLGLMRLIKR